MNPETIVAEQNCDLDKAIDVLRAIAHPLRIRLVNLLQQFDTLQVNEIYQKLHLDPAFASQQLKILRNAHIVTLTRKGRCMYYSLNRPFLMRIALAVDNFSLS